MMALHPDLIDFSIMGYNGNLWQRLPQITLRHDFTENLQGLVTGHAVRARTDAVLRSDAGCDRSLHLLTERLAGIKLRSNGSMTQIKIRTMDRGWHGPDRELRRAWWLQSMPPIGTTAQPRRREIPCFNPAVISIRMSSAASWSCPSGTLKFSGEIAYGQALGVEWFRFNQELNLVNGNPIRSFVGWARIELGRLEGLHVLGRLWMG